MIQDEFETVLSMMAAQYADACAEEIIALEDEAKNKRHIDNLKTRLQMFAHDSGTISGRNKEMRDLQATSVLEQSETYQQDHRYFDQTVSIRKAATMKRIGIENEWKMWRAWLASQGGTCST